MAGQTPAGMWKLVDRKPFTVESERALKKEGERIVPDSRRDYALELKLACTRRRVRKLKDVTPFLALLDTGYNGSALMSRWHYEYRCNEPIPFDDLPPSTTPPELIDGSEMENVRHWWGRLWLFPEGERPDIQEPIPFVPGQGIEILPPHAVDVCIGLSAMQALDAHVEIDCDRELFSVFVPKRIITSR